MQPSLISFIWVMEDTYKKPFFVLKMIRWLFLGPLYNMFLRGPDKYSAKQVPLHRHT